MKAVQVRFKVLENGGELPTPSYATASSAGMDLYAAVKEDVTLKPGERKLLPAGFAMALPEGYEAQVRPRSGLALKNGVTVLNTPGTIDADYRGEVCVILVNLGQDAFTVTRGMRMAQMVIAPCSHAALVVVNDLDETVRGQGGFGSTGTHG